MDYWSRLRDRVARAFTQCADRREAAFRHGNASEIPFPDAWFDFVVCTAAFKNFSDPVGGLNEIHRVLAPGGHASIIDLRKDASRDDIATQVRDMRLSTINALVTRWTFRFFLLKRAYRRAALESGKGNICYGFDRDRPIALLRPPDKRPG